MILETALQNILENILESTKLRLACPDKNLKRFLTLTLATDSTKACLKPFSNRLVIFAQAKEALRWYEAFLALEDGPFTAHYLPPLSFWGRDRSEDMRPLKHQRMAATYDLLDPAKPTLVFASLYSLFQKSTPTHNLKSSRLKLCTGEVYTHPDIEHNLKNLGYISTSQVNQTGLYAIRGGIIDIFPVSTAEPYRLEFFGDELISIRGFSLDTGRSTSEINSLEVLPADDVLVHHSPAQTQDFYDYLLSQEIPQNERSFFLQAFSEEDFGYKDLFAPLFWEESHTLWEYLLRHTPKKSLFIFPESLEKCLSYASERAKDLESDFLQDQTQKKPTISPHLHYESPSLEHLHSAEVHYVELASLNPSMTLQLDPLLAPSEDLGQNVLFQEKLFFKAKPKVSSTSRLKAHFASLREITPNSFVVHIDHGVCRYLGMNQLTLDGRATDLLKLEFKNEEYIYLPVEKLSLIQKYQSATESSAPTLDKLGSLAWAERKAKAAKKAEDIAERLIQIHAHRDLLQKISFTKAGETYQKIVDEFPYEETPDQLRCLEEVEADLASSKLMDRLLVGDVGFGKTEIALRVAARHALEGNQVLLLAPTTLLCSQHFQVFRGRLEKHGLLVEQLSRFVPAKKQKEVLLGLEKGSVDILVGTHRILSKDIKTKRLGLLIVDEEQKFGVKHKESLKELSYSCDVLNMTATPIPRSLHMGMIGLRDISLITTPPPGRLPVKNLILAEHEATLKEAISFELNRGGQVFYLYNKLPLMNEEKARLQKLFPKVKIAIAHGQMKEEKLEPLIMDFIEQKYQILICSTIIESGIDIPKVNTLIVKDAQNFGLSQLYQLRGRVGRSKFQGYAYFFYPQGHPLNDEARQRLEVMGAYQELGSGFNIASFDMDIRGVGNLLGKEQSGHVKSVGLELYTSMLEAHVRKLRGEGSLHLEKDVELKIKAEAFLPTSYIPTERERLILYRQIFSAKNTEELSMVRDDTKDRFGKLPPSAEAIMGLAELKIILKNLGASKILQVTGRPAFEIILSDSNKRIALAPRFQEPFTTVLKQTHIQDLCKELYALHPSPHL